MFLAHTSPATTRDSSATDIDAAARRLFRLKLRDSVNFGYITTEADSKVERGAFSFQKLEGDTSLLAMNEVWFLKRFLKKREGKIDLVTYPNDQLAPSFRKKINALSEPKAVIDIGTSRFKIMIARPNRDLTVLKIPMPFIKKAVEPKASGANHIIWNRLGVNSISLHFKEAADSFRLINNFRQLAPLLSFAKVYLKTYGLKNGIKDNGVLPVATESLRRLTNHYHPVFNHYMKWVFGVYGIDVISPETESKLQYKALTYGIQDWKLKNYLTVDIGGGSTDCAYLKKNEVQTLGFQLGHRLNGLSVPSPVDVFDYDSLMTLVPIFKKRIQDERQQYAHLPSEVNFLLTDFKPELLRYIELKFPGRSLFAIDREAKPLSRDEILSDLLSQDALTYYKKQDALTTGDSFKKRPVRLLQLALLMEELKIDKLLLGTEGGMKMPLLETLIDDGRDKKPAWDFELLKKSVKAMF